MIVKLCFWYGTPDICCKQVFGTLSLHKKRSGTKLEKTSLSANAFLGPQTLFCNICRAYIAKKARFINAGAILALKRNKCAIICRWRA